MKEGKGNYKLEKDIKVRHFFVLAFGCIIGVGWVVYLGNWLEQAGPLGAILGFSVGGLLIMIVGLCYAEMATTLPVSGGEVAYTYETFGLKTSFATGWFLSLTFITFTSFEAISVGWIAGTLVPGIEGATLYMNREDPVQLGSLFLGLGGMILLTYLNYRGIKSAVIFQEFFTYVLIILSLVFIFAGIIWGKTSNLEPLFSKPGFFPAIGSIVAIIITVPVWFGGFNIIPQVMEEKAEGVSLKMVGQVILLAIGGALVFYLLVILSASMSTPWPKLLTQELPAAGAFEAAFHSPLLAKTVLFAALCGIITTWNTIFIASSRIIFALGRARIIPSAFGKVHSVFGSPSIAVIFVGFIGFVGVFWGRNALVPIVNVGSFCFALAYLLSCLGVIKLRLSRPDLHRPYRVPGGIFTAAVGSLVSLFMLLYSLYQPYVNSKGSFPLEWAIILGWSVIGILFWVGAHKVRKQVSEPERRRLILDACAPLEKTSGGTKQIY